MPSSGLLRQRLNSLLEEQVIPNIRQGGATEFISATFPLSATANIAVRSLSVPPLSISEATKSFPNGLHWKSMGVHSIDFPTLYCVCDGELDLRLGVTIDAKEASKTLNEVHGIYIASMKANSYMLIPPGVPHWDGIMLPWERTEPGISSRVLSVRVLPTAVLCHTTLIHNNRSEPNYSILLEDPYFWSATALLMEESQNSVPNQELIHAQLLVFFLRLRRGLQNSFLLMTDGLYSRFPTRLAQTLATPSQVSITEKACAFIQLHLHKPLDPSLIAQHVRLKPAQLNRLFRQEFDLSVMQYVVQHRLRAAKLLLQTSELSIQDISRLVGFKNGSHFSRSFLENEGTSPLKYRQNNSRRF